MTDGNSEFIGATKMQIEYLKDALRDQRQDIKAIAATLQELRDFKSRVLAYAGIAAAVATFGIQFLMDKMGN